MVNFVFIAPPAAGKGTQSKLLVEKYGYNHISTGDLLREEINSGSEKGMQISQIISSGKLVDDETVCYLLEKKLKSILNTNKPFIIDGFPRTLNQAKLLVNIFKSLNVSNYKVIYMDLDYEEASKRVLGRMICPNCGKSYNKLIDSFKPLKDGICDNCDSALEQRIDDNEESFKVRYDTFITNTKPMLVYYTDINRLINISASRDADDIFKDIETYVTGVTADD